MFGDYYLRQAKRSDAEIAMQAKVKEMQMRQVFVTVGPPRAPEPVVNVAVLGSADKRLVAHHRRIFSALFGKPIALTTFDLDIEHLKGEEGIVQHDALSVCVDCHTENLLFENGKLSFMDAYPPKDLWRIGAFELDIFRVGADIYAFAGEDAFRAYLAGAQGGDVEEVEKLYLMYGVVLACPYFLMLAKKNQEYRPKAERYLGFVERC